MKLFDKMKPVVESEPVMNKLYYTDRIDEYQYGDEDDRLEVVVKESCRGKSVELRRLPEGRRFVRQDVASMGHYADTFDKIAGYAWNTPGKMRVEFDTIRHEDKTDLHMAGNTMKIVKSWIVVEKKNSANLMKVHIITDDEENEYVYQVVAQGENVVFSSLTVSDDSEAFEDDEMVIELPSFMAVSSKEMKLLKLLRDVAGVAGEDNRAVKITGYLN